MKKLLILAFALGCASPTAPLSTDSPCSLTMRSPLTTITYCYKQCPYDAEAFAYRASFEYSPKFTCEGTQ